MKLSIECDLLIRKALCIYVHMKVKAVCISEKKGTVKKNIGSCEVTATGLKGDAHAGDWHRQVSLLAEESIDKMTG